MIRNRLDALVDAFANLNACLSPDSDAYQLRNPLLLRAFSPKHERDELGRRIFKNWSSGFDNARIDLSVKCSGKSHSKLTPDSTLMDLVCYLGNKPPACRKIKNHLIRALGDDTIKESQALGWFIESETQNEYLFNKESQ